MSLCGSYLGGWESNHHNISCRLLSTYYVRACALSHVRFFATPWTVAHQAPLSMGFPRQEYWQEYWSGSPFPPPGDLPDPAIKPVSPASPALANSLPPSHWGIPTYILGVNRMLFWQRHYVQAGSDTPTFLGLFFLRWS